MKKMAGYVRVSTPMQVERGDSLTAQEERLKAEAKRRGWRLSIYREEGISAKDAARPAYQSMRSDLQARKLDGVVVTNLDRLFRSLKMAVNEIDTIAREWGRELVTLDQKIDTSTAAGRAMVNTLLTFGQFERELTAERVRDAALTRANEGRFNGSRIPFGYQKESRGVWAINAEEAALVREIFDVYLTKRTGHGVVRALREGGRRTRSGAEWTIWDVKRVLFNPTYQGDRVWNRHLRGRRRPTKEHIVKENAVPAIVSREIFETAQRLRVEIKAAFPPRSHRSPYLLSGLVRCEHCGSRMHGQENQRWKYYRCAGAQVKGPAVCPKKTWIRADKLEGEVVKRLFHFRVDPEELKAALKANNEERRAELPKLKKQIAHLEGRLTQLSGRREHIKDAYEDGEYSLQEMKVRLRKAEQETKETENALAQARAEMEGILRDTTDVERVVQVLETAWGLYAGLDFAGRQELIRTLIGRVVVKDAEHACFTVSHLDKILVAPRTGEYHMVLKPPAKIPENKGEILGHSAPRKQPQESGPENQGIRVHSE